MRYIKKFENFKPIKINNEKPFKVKKNIDKSIRYLQKGIKSLRKRLDDEDINNSNKINKDKRLKMNNDKNNKIQQLKELTLKQTKQNNYLRSIKENYENNVLLDILESNDFNSYFHKTLLQHLGLNENTYEVSLINKDKLSLLINSSILENLMNIEKGVINYTFGWANNNSYSNYNYQIEDDELEYLNSYLTTENLDKIKELANICSYDINIKENNSIYEFFKYLGLIDELSTIKIDIEEAHENAITKVAEDVLNSLPFIIEENYNNKYDIKITILYDKLLEEIKKNTNIKTIKDFIENSYNDFSYEIEYDSSKYEYLNYDILNKNINIKIDDFISSPDDLFPKIIKIDNIDFFKKNLGLANFSYTYRTYIDYIRSYATLFDLVTIYNSTKILEWMKTPEFEEIMMNRTKDEHNLYRHFLYPELDKYNL